MPRYRIEFHADEVLPDGEDVTVPRSAVSGTIDIEEPNERAARKFIEQFDVEVDSCVEIDDEGEPVQRAAKKKG